MVVSMFRIWYKKHIFIAESYSDRLLLWPSFSRLAKRKISQVTERALGRYTTTEVRSNGTAKKAKSGPSCL